MNNRFYYQKTILWKKIPSIIFTHATKSNGITFCVICQKSDPFSNVKFYETLRQPHGSLIFFYFKKGLFVYEEYVLHQSGMVAYGIINRAIQITGRE